MDYKYINQLLERYWRCETSLEEESILRAFFSQDNVPVELLRYKALFGYAEKAEKSDVLGEDFDEKLMKKIAAQEPVKARIITMPQRLRPLFKAAAVVAIVLTLGNAMQMPFSKKADPMANYDGYTLPQIDQTNSVAMGDSAVTDTMKQSMMDPKATQAAPIVK